MRVFFAVDGKSHIKPETLQKLLALSLPHECYAVLPLESSRFPPRAQFNALFRHAKLEAQKVLNHYEDASHCVVIVCGLVPNVHKKSEAVPLDYAVVLYRNGETVHQPLNEKVGPHYIASAPTLQPLLADSAIELAGIQMLG